MTATVPPLARVRVRDALRHLATGGDWPFPSWTVLQNRLLDEVGGDLRPLVALLVRAAEAGLVDQLPRSAAAWAGVRGALVLSLTNSAFLQPEMARWAVECWGYAFGLVDEAGLTAASDPRAAPPAPPARESASNAAAAERRDGAAARAPHAAGGLPAVVAARRNAAPNVRPTPPAAPAFALPPAPAPTASRPSAPRAVPRRPPGLLPHGLDNPIAGASLLGIVGFAGYVVYGALGFGTARATEVAPSLDAAPAAAARPEAPARTAAGIPGVTSHGLPTTAADSAGMIRVVPARRPTLSLDEGPPTAVAAGRPAAAAPPPRASGVVVPLPSPAAVPAPAVSPPAPTAGDGFDRLRLRGGRVVRGRVELVRVGAVVFRDADTGLRYEYPKADVEAVVTEFGSVVRFSPEAGGGPGVEVGRAGSAVVRRGVGGRYRVRYALVGISGSPECRRGWAGAPADAWARVDHAPGADTLAVTFEGGATFASVIDADGQFASTFVIVPDQAYSGSALTTRLSGRFAPAGFDAAVNLVGYRRVRAGRDVACHTVLRAVGERAPDGGR